MEDGEKKKKAFLCAKDDDNRQKDIFVVPVDNTVVLITFVSIK